MLPCFALAVSLGVNQTLRRLSDSTPILFDQRVADADSRAILAPRALALPPDLSTIEATDVIANAAPPIMPVPRGEPAPADVTPPPVASSDRASDAPAPFAVCLPDDRRQFGAAGQHSEAARPGEPASFGKRLAAAALAQTQDLVIYSAKYRRIGFPMGDMSPFFGACTDLVIRAYRTLGIDLQKLVHERRVGSGDTSVDHRRTEVLRRLFARYGQSLSVSEFPEDYQPGDIVTYERPFSRISRSHIAVVADVIAPSGRPMIIHNRGWGPQLEDALFVDRITGHYRFIGVPPSAQLWAAASNRNVALEAGPAQPTLPPPPVVQATASSRPEF